MIIDDHLKTLEHIELCSNCTGSCSFISKFCSKGHQECYVPDKTVQLQAKHMETINTENAHVVQ